MGTLLLRNATNDQLSRIDEILRQLDQSVPTKEQENRRRSPRIIIHTTLDTYVLSPGGNLGIQIFTRNISTSGIGFVSRRFCKVGENIALSFILPDRSPKLVLAHITFSRYVRAGLYEAGAEFAECISGEGERDIPPHWSRRMDSPQAPDSQVNQTNAAKAKKSARKQPEKAAASAAADSDSTDKTAPEIQHDPAPTAHNAGNSAA
jgi:hypothetical protein